MRRPLGAVLLLALLVTAGCASGGGEPTADPAPAPGTSPTSPSPTSPSPTSPSPTEPLVTPTPPTREEQARLDRRLLAAAESGDADATARLLERGADVEARDVRRRTPLLLAVTFDHVEVARLLVAAGADPDALDERHDTPWLVTGVTGSVAMLEALLPADPDLTIRNRYGGVSVIPASERGHVAYVRRVVTTGIDVDHVNDLGWTALLEAVILGDGSRPYQQIVTILLDAGADRSIADGEGVTALQHAEARGQDEVARILRQR